MAGATETEVGYVRELIVNNDAAVDESKEPKVELVPRPGRDRG